MYKPTALVEAVKEYEAAKLDLAQGWREHPRTMDSLADLSRAERHIAEATANVAAAKAKVTQALNDLNAVVERAISTY
jgi:flagellar biosynthesis/type III secretory pathway ATPase